jgi:hypothetical protein
VVLLEDSGAMLGLFVAIGGIGLSEITGNAIWDGIATFIIGVILASIAVTLAIELKTQHLGPEDLLIVARVKFDGELAGDDLATAIGGVHARLKEAVPIADFVYIEPELRSGSRRRSRPRTILTER